MTWSSYISALGTLAKLILTQASALLEDNIARITEASGSLCVDEESVPLKQSSVKWSKEKEKNEINPVLFLNASWSCML